MRESKKVVFFFFFSPAHTRGETVFAHIIKKDIDEQRGSFPLQRRADFRGPSDLTFHTGTCQRYTLHTLAQTANYFQCLISHARKTTQKYFLKKREKRNIKALAKTD
jgi:hypothetical protein